MGHDARWRTINSNGINGNVAYPFYYSVISVMSFSLFFFCFFLVVGEDDNRFMNVEVCGRHEGN